MSAVFPWPPVSSRLPTALGGLPAPIPSRALGGWGTGCQAPCDPAGPQRPHALARLPPVPDTCHCTLLSAWGLSPPSPVGQAFPGQSPWLPATFSPRPMYCPLWLLGNVRPRGWGAAGAAGHAIRRPAWLRTCSDVTRHLCDTHVAPRPVPCA